MNNIFVLNKNYSKIGTLSNQGANPQAPYYEDLYVQELETGADTYQFSTISNKYTQDLLEIGNHIMFAYRGRNELFTITSLEYSHNEGYKTIGVYAEGIGFELLEVFMERPKDKNGNSSSGGNDSDNDGDDNTDDEYADPDDVYIDANGNIIYDKNGGNKPSADDVTIDGNGNIIYKRSKNNSKNDSLEFKNISYPRFLSILLKNSGWTYSCQPGLESIKHDITVRYDRNIYAILQDSMQDYKGVELEFVHEYNNGKVQKIIKAYKDGGRGSFIGNRFEYGTNVRGITKTQKVANSEDDTVYFVDDVGIEVTYDIDFALKSSEVPEIEIGDTHYVIDNDFYPPMQIKARIGKIEISFSDPTVNKIYVANNKRVSGSAIEDEFGADDVADMLDDYDDGPVSDHYHCELVSSYDTDGLSDKIGFYVGGFGPDSPEAASKYYLGFSHAPWYMLWVDNIHCFEYITVQKGISCNSLTVGDIYLRGQIIYQNDGEGEEGGSGVESVFDALHVNYDLTVGEDTDEYTRTHLTSRSVSAHFAYITERLETDTIYVDRIRFSDGTSLTTAGSGGSGSGGTDNPGSGSYGDIIVDSLKIYSSEDDNYVPVRLTNAGIGADIIVADYEVSTPKLLVSDELPDDASANISPEIVVRRRNSAELKITPDGIEFSDGSTLTSANGLSGEGVTPGTGGGTPSTGNVFDTITVRKIQGPDRGEGQYKCVEFADAIGVSHIYCASEDDNDVIFIGDHVSLHAGMTLLSNIQLQEDGCIEFPDGSRLTSANGLGSGGGSSADNITANKITIGTPTDSKASKCSLCVKGNTLVEGNLYIEGGNGLYVNGTPGSDKSLKENIRYVDNTGTIIVDKENLETRDYHNEDLLEKTDLHDFIVNQVNICEYNFIGKDRNKIGFIANEYEGTKVGDKIVNRDKELDLLFYDSDNLLFATIGALQEEVRIKDEKIASLEDRLAKIEAMLGINNDN